MIGKYYNLIEFKKNAQNSNPISHKFNKIYPKFKNKKKIY